MLISTPQDIPRFEALLGDGKRWGLNISYCVQPSPDGLAHAFILGKDFINGAPSALVLGDNIFYGHDFQGLLGSANACQNGATVFAYHVTDPERYGGWTSKPIRRPFPSKKSLPFPKSKYAVTRLPCLGKPN